MRDIVSMISELDRLDEELRLASDIQVNMLPMRLAVIEISTGRGKACNAGHENPVMKRAGGEYEVLRYRHNMALGISKMAKYTKKPKRRMIVSVGVLPHVGRTSQTGPTHRKTIFSFEKLILLHVEIKSLCSFPDQIQMLPLSGHT